jgi:hypothetical protein
MLPSAVVEHLKVIDHILSGFLPGRIMTMCRALALETAEEPLRNRMVPAIPLPAHPTGEVMSCQETLVRLTRLLTAPICMMPQSC